MEDMMVHLAVVGSRKIDSKALVYEWLTKALIKCSGDLVIVSGGAKGVDSLAAEFAEDHGIPVLEFKPDWKRHGRSAGFKRNHLIWEHANCGIAFWDGESKGTAHSFRIARDMDKPITVITLTVQHDMNEPLTLKQENL
jgi:hypothetical protein